MKKVEAIIRPEMLEIVRSTLEEVGVIGMTVTRVEGRGRQRGLIQRYNGKEFRVEFLVKIKIELLLDDKDVERVVTIIQEAARTGQVGDGKIVVYPVEDVIRIRTGERGSKAL